MAENFRDNEARERFELDVEGHTAFVTYRKSPAAITLVHTEVPPELGGKGVGSKLARATLEAVRTQGRKLMVECDFIRNFMSKHAEYNDLLASGQATNKHQRRDLYRRLLLRRRRGRSIRRSGFRRLLPLQGLPGLVGGAGQRLQPVEVRRCARHQRRLRHRHLQQDRELLPEILQDLRRPCHDRASSHAAHRRLCQSAAGIHAPADAACELRKQDAFGKRRLAEICRLSFRPRRLRREIAGLDRRMGKGAKRRAHHPSSIMLRDGGHASLCPPYRFTADARAGTIGSGAPRAAPSPLAPSTETG